MGEGQGGEEGSGFSEAVSSSRNAQSDRIRPMLTNEEEEEEEEEKEELMTDGGAEEEMTEESSAKVARAPTVPSRWEKERHEVAHIPFRSWCPTCVAGRGVKAPHEVKKKREEDELPRFSMDYGFMGQEDQESAVLLAMRELKTGMMLGMVVPRKGLAESWIERRVAQFMNSFGYKKVLLRSDNENSIVALRKMIIKLCDAEVIDEDSIKGESQTNGLAEVGVKIIEGIVRTLKIDLEKNMKKAVDNKSVALAWLVEHSCVVYNRCTVCSDGRTPWQRAYGKAASLPLVPFGEKVLYKKLKATGDKKNSLEPRFSYGIYLGSRPKSGEHYIGIEEGVIRCRDVRRLAEDKRYDVEMLEKIKGTPWSPLGGDAMLEVPTNIKTETLRPDENDEYRPILISRR